MIKTKVIETRLVPEGDTIAITLFGFVFTRHREYITRRVLNHELIHCQQQLEWLYLPFFLLYGLEWVWHLLRCHNALRAYFLVSFEREAYANEHDLSYLRHRPPFANYRKRRS